MIGGGIGTHPIGGSPRNEMQDFQDSFLKLFAQLLVKEGFKDIQLEPMVMRNAPAPDFVAINLENERVAGEVKLYRTANIPLMSATFAIRKLRQSILTSQAKRGMFVTSAKLPPPYISSLDFQNSQLTIWDLNRLVTTFKKYPDLDEKFQSFLNDLQPFADPNPPQALEKKQEKTESPVDQKNLESARAALEELTSQPTETKGHKLADELLAIPPSNSGAREFEKKCTEAIHYLFGSELSIKKEQVETDDRLHRFDLIARISSNNEFWLTLQNHFRGKYVIFEFKNHEECITQREIYTTEKYLYLPAMRSVAIIISRMGPDKNASHAARGALREHGKVIINLSVQDVCKMLRMKDTGSSTSDFMISILDEMLIKIER